MMEQMRLVSGMRETARLHPDALTIDDHHVAGAFRYPLPAGVQPLTDREREVLRQVAAGRCDRQIAQALNISRKTASNHMTNILRKLGVRTRAAAVAQMLHVEELLAGDRP